MNRISEEMGVVSATNGREEGEDKGVRGGNSKCPKFAQDRIVTEREAKRDAMAMQNIGRRCR